jgi:hypothetical protein
MNYYILNRFTRNLLTINTEVDVKIVVQPNIAIDYHTQTNNKELCNRNLELTIVSTPPQEN